MVTDLKSNRIDAVTLEKAVAESYAFRNRDLINIECHKDAFGRPLGSAIAVKKGDKDLLDEINKIIRKLKHENKIYEYLEDAKILLNK